MGLINLYYVKMVGEVEAAPEGDFKKYKEKMIEAANTAKEIKNQMTPQNLINRNHLGPKAPRQQSLLY